MKNRKIILLFLFTLASGCSHSSSPLDENNHTINGNSPDIERIKLCPEAKEAISNLITLHTHQELNQFENGVFYGFYCKK